MCFDELAVVYEVLFESIDAEFLNHGEPSLQTIEAMSSLDNYYTRVFRRRASRRIPLSITMTFEIIKFYVLRHRLIKSTTDQALLDQSLDSLFQSSATKVFKTVNQIVDLSQKGKFAVSF